MDRSARRDAPVSLGSSPSIRAIFRKASYIYTRMGYTFKPFKWLATMDGFNYPVDVYNGPTWIGTLVAEPDGFVITMIDTPNGKQTIAKSKENKFKSQTLAAEMLGRVWRIYRSHD